MGFTRITLQKESYQKGSPQTGTREYLVEADPEDDPVFETDAATDASVGEFTIPQIGEAWSDARDRATARTVEATRLTSTDAYVVVNYSSASEDETTENDADPLDEPPQFRFGGSLTSEPFFRDVDDELMTTSAGEEFADLPVRVRPQFTIAVTRNRSSFNHGAAAAAIPRVNATATSINGTTYAERTLRLDSVTAEGPLQRDGVTYWRVTTNLTARASTWDVLLEDRGLYETDDNGQQVPILDATGSPVRSPYPLNGMGKAQPNPTDAPAIIDRRAYEVGSLAAWI